MELNDFHYTGKYLKELRLNKGLTQTELSKQLGLHGQFVSNWERGLSIPPSHCFHKSLDVLNADRKTVVKMMVMDSKRLIEEKIYKKKRKLSR